MARVTRAADHLSVAEVAERRAQATLPWHQRAWDVVYTALVDPRSSFTIARQFGVSRAFVATLIARYHRLGPDHFLGPGRGGRHHAYLTPEQETAFLAPFRDQAESGDLTTIAPIQTALEQQLGHAVDDSTIYRMLARHAWRPVMPRPRHPKADVASQQDWKKKSPT